MTTEEQCILQAGVWGHLPLMDSRADSHADGRHGGHRTDCSDYKISRPALVFQGGFRFSITRLPSIGNASLFHFSPAPDLPPRTGGHPQPKRPDALPLPLARLWSSLAYRGKDDHHGSHIGSSTKPIMSSMEAPGATMGRTLSSIGISQSTTTGRLRLKASWMTAAGSSSLPILMPSTP